MNKDILLIDLEKEGIIGENLQDIANLLDKDFYKVNKILLYIEGFDDAYNVYNPEELGLCYLTGGKEYSLKIPTEYDVIQVDSDLSYIALETIDAIHRVRLDSGEIPYRVDSVNKKIYFTMSSIPRGEDVNPFSGHIDFVLYIYSGLE